MKLKWDHSSFPLVLTFQCGADKQQIFQPKLLNIHLFTTVLSHAALFAET